MCCALTQVTLGTRLGEYECWAATTVMFAVMVAVPGFMLLGESGDPTFAHAYFAPGWFGNASLLVPAARYGVDLLSSKELLRIPEVQEAVESLEAGQRIEWLTLDGEWVDRTHRLGELGHPEWNNYYNTCVHGFWQTIVDEVVQAPCVLVLQGHWSWRRGKHDVAHIIKPSNV